MADEITAGNQRARLANAQRPTRWTAAPHSGLRGLPLPVENVYLCGSGSHPGAGVPMATGRNAAQVIYGDLSSVID